MLRRIVQVSCLTGSPGPLKEIPVVARLAFGSERLSLVLTGTSMIIAHGGKRGAGAVVGTNFFGRLSGALEDFFKTRKDLGRDRTIRSQNVNMILKADKDNFKINYDDIVNIDVDAISPGVTAITVLTRNEKLEFLSRKEYDGIIELLDNQLGPKVRPRRL